MPSDPVLASVDAQDGARLAAVFRAWAGDDADLLVCFTPDVLVGVAGAEARGWLFDDVWSVECWIEEGTSTFVELVEAAFGDRADAVLDPAGTSRGADASRRLMTLVAARGRPIADVRHLL